MAREQFTDRQLTEVIDRRSPHHPRGMIDRDMIQALLDGRLVLREEAMSTASGRLIDISDKVELLIQAGYHEAAGLSASVYRRLWPKTVVQPPEYAGRFDEVLLVDRAIAITKLVRCGNIYLWVDPSACYDLAPMPTASRYIAFIQLGRKNLGLTVENCSKTFAPDEVGLTTVEGLYLPVQHKAYLRQYAVDLAGSRCDSVFAPCVYWFSLDQPHFCAYGVRSSNPRYGSASRGSAVITVP